MKIKEYQICLCFNYPWESKASL